ncbi:hypothetical protein FOMPIDRAFT_1018403 [Fomitopsis schrenkii]|uniref:Uncharacterized protein n=1 Tax=Fomitopsis schrenkii TaxID=2126942 RepID=S8FFK2_FOMSC|nr:hypothetical protein FOMPIDRAFT_1018403 [Fomitopsis schrenkii]
MSMQIHAPAPIMSTASRSMSPPPTLVADPRSRGRSQSRRPTSHSRQSSPLAQAAQLQSPRPPMARPSSRSERLLRDTLRRAEEHDRMLSVHPLPSPKQSGASLPGSPFLAPTGTMLINGSAPASSQQSRRHSRKSTASSAASISCDLCDLHFDSLGESLAEQDADDEDDDLHGWSSMRAGTSASSSSSGHGPVHVYFQGTPTQPGPSRTRNIAHSGHAGERAYADTGAQVAYGTPSSPSPARARLQCSAPSAPHIGRDSHAQTRSPERAPHDAVLRHKLEGVLRGAKEQERRGKSTERRHREAGSSSGSGNSMASSRNLSAESDLFYAVGESSVTSLSSAESKTNPTATAPSRGSFSTSSRPYVLHVHSRSPMNSPSTPSRQLSSPRSQSSANPLSPLTPPPTPPFNARTAAEQCRAMDGYVSFANIEGLGVPEGAVDEDMDDDDGKTGMLWRWFYAKRARGRSGSTSSVGVAS